MTLTDFPVMIKNNQVAFSRKLLRGNYCTYEVDVDALYSPFGFLVPMQNDSLDFLDYFEGGWDAIALHNRALSAVLIDHRSRIYELILGTVQPPTPPDFSKLRAIPNQATGYVRSRMSKDDQRARCAIAATTSLSDAALLMNRNLDSFGADYIVLDIPQIVKRLNDQDFTRPIPRYAPPTPPLPEVRISTDQLKKA